MSPRGRVRRKKTGAAQQAKAAPTSIVRWGIAHRIVPGAVECLHPCPPVRLGSSACDLVVRSGAADWEEIAPATAVTNVTFVTGGA